MQDKTRICFVGGIHGSGKSSLCEQLGAILGIGHVTASELIRSSPDAEIRRHKLVHDVQGNQDLLLAALRQRCGLGEDFLLDGHFCLLDKTGAPIRIPEKTLYAIDPVGVVLVSADPAAIRERLMRRDSVAYEVGMIEQHACEESAYAREVCAYLGIPMLEWCASDGIEGARDFVACLLSEGEASRAPIT